jgi:hypothetical protein
VRAEPSRASLRKSVRMFAHACRRIRSQQPNDDGIVEYSRWAVEYLMRGAECRDSNGRVTGWSIWHPSKMCRGSYLFNQ